MFNYLSKKHWYIRVKLSSDMITDIERSILNLEKTEHNFVNHLLAGKINEEYFIETPSSVQNFIFNTLSKNKNNIIKSGTSVGNLKKFSYTNNSHTSYKKIHSWINFQKKYEYNPTHSHSGDFSYVIWHKIPYSLIDEKIKGPGSISNSSENGSFNFYFVNDNIEVKHLSIPNSIEDNGTLLIFPAKQLHSVNPFYSSDDYRITLSGNITEVQTIDLKNKII